MPVVDRRSFIEMALSLGATTAWAFGVGTPSRAQWVERRDLYPEGVASGDPDDHSVLLWTRYPHATGDAEEALAVEVSQDLSFEQVVATAHAFVSRESDWTCRVLVGGLNSGRVYWYRFTDRHGFGSRVGRTRTAPQADDANPVRFAFISCEDANQGSQSAYRRMIFEDERVAEQDQLCFVLHLVENEMVWYPEDRPQGMCDPKHRDVVRYKSGEKIEDFHIPTTLADYRDIYRMHLRDPDLQDARARWPFVSMWGNDGYSGLGWQSSQVFEGKTRPAQTRIAANQAFFEYRPARMSRPGRRLMDRFKPLHMIDTAIKYFDEHGLGQEPNNLTALASLKGYRRIRWGQHIDLMITDQRTYRSEEQTGRSRANASSSGDLPELIRQEAKEITNAGRPYNGGQSPSTKRFGNLQMPYLREDDPPRTILGAEQKAWFFEQLRSSTATWKIWGNSPGTLDWRTESQNLQSDITKPWPSAGFDGGDHSIADVERAEIYEFVRDSKITGFATVAVDRHSFWSRRAAMLNLCSGSIRSARAF
jgi:alkaline phosphatase D